MQRRQLSRMQLDAFYAQVEEVRDPSLAQRPLGITQKYLVVTSNYPARKRGVTKLMNIKEAKVKSERAILPRHILYPW